MAARKQTSRANGHPHSRTHRVRGGVLRARGAPRRAHHGRGARRPGARLARHFLRARGRRTARSHAPRPRRALAQGPRSARAHLPARLDGPEVGVPATSRSEGTEASHRAGDRGGCRRAARAVRCPVDARRLPHRHRRDRSGPTCACLRRGRRREDGPSGVAFRHELARRAVEESLPPNRRLLLHRKALNALADPPTGAPDLERLSHHADAAGDGPAVLRFAPAAAVRAAAVGAHREAAAQYARALQYAESRRRSTP